MNDILDSMTDYLDHFEDYIAKKYDGNDMQIGR